MVAIQQGCPRVIQPGARALDQHELDLAELFARALKARERYRRRRRCCRGLARSATSAEGQSDQAAQFELGQGLATGPVEQHAIVPALAQPLANPPGQLRPRQVGEVGDSSPNALDKPGPKNCPCTHIPVRNTSAERPRQVWMLVSACGGRNGAGDRGSRRERSLRSASFPASDARALPERAPVRAKGQCQQSWPSGQRRFTRNVW